MKSGTRRRSALTMAGAVLATVALTACDDSDGAKSGGNGGNDKKASAEASKPLKLGQPSPEKQEDQRYGKKGEFIITPQRVVMGKASDLTQLDASKYQGKTLAWVYVKAKLDGGDKEIKGPMLSTDVGTVSEGEQRGTRLILIGNLSSAPADCKDEDTQATWKQGDEKTFCTPFIVPDGKKITHVTYARGFYKEPLKWTTD
ncbi:hypothetical protein [Streptomyces griseocarneus]|uniref:hypothetical protein n=1 Tax=Streptomyces griseocarneus TaxID=51201 RepID=UPI00167D594E|nr:hypothetical protein [Streptomyces griseocarneus]MBZ6477118.1 hypothetical protein [Streptomyces griseocarneus]